MGVLVFGFDSDCTEGYINSIASHFPNEKIFWVTARYDEYSHSDQIHVVRRFELPLFSRIGDREISEELYRSIDQKEYFYLLNRLYKYYGELSIKDKKSILKYQLVYWEDFLERNDIRLFINSNLPHETSDYVIYHLCLLRKIETILFYQVFASCVIAINRIEDLSEILLKDDLEGSETTPAIKKFVSDRKSSEYKLPFYMKEEKIIRHKKEVKKQKLKRRIRKKRNLKTLFSLQNYYRLRWIFYKYFKQDQRSLYKEVSEAPDYNLKYIYFPLHYQPEMTSCPMAKNGYYDQLKILKDLVSILPEDIWVFVKENPKQDWICRDLDYYKRMKELPNVCLVDLDFSSDELIENSEGVVTISGTAGWEAFLRGKRVLTFGHVVYNAMNQVFSVGDDELYWLVNQLLNNEINPLKLALDQFLTHLSELSVEANISQYYFENSINKGEHENIQQLERLLEQALVKEQI